MFEDYADDHTVIFEGFHGQLPFEFMLPLLDQLECLVQRSGGPCQFVATKIFITSLVHPREWYSKLSNSDAYQQQEHRMTCVVHLDDCIHNEWSKRARVDTGPECAAPLTSPSTRAVRVPVEQFMVYRSVWVPKGFRIRPSDRDGNCLFHSTCVGRSVTASELRPTCCLFDVKSLFWCCVQFFVSSVCVFWIYDKATCRTVHTWQASWNMDGGIPAVPCWHVSGHGPSWDVILGHHESRGCVRWVSRSTRGRSCVGHWDFHSQRIYQQWDFSSRMWGRDRSQHTVWRHGCALRRTRALLLLRFRTDNTCRLKMIQFMFLLWALSSACRVIRSLFDCLSDVSVFVVPVRLLPLLRWSYTFHGSCSIGVFVAFCGRKIRVMTWSQADPVEGWGLTFVCSLKHC